MVSLGVIVPIVAGIMGAVATVALQQLIKWYNSPSLHITWFTNQGKSPEVVERLIDKSTLDTQHGNLERKEKSKDIHLSLKNAGNTPARECKIKAEVHEGVEKISKPVRLGTRIRPPILYEGLDTSEQWRMRTKPFQINPDDEVLIDLLRATYEEEAYKDGKDVTEKNVRLGTLASFRNIEFEPNKKYNIDITVTSANSEPAEFSFVVEWDGSVDEEGLLESIKRKESNTLYF